MDFRQADQHLYPGSEIDARSVRDNLDEVTQSINRLEDGQNEINQALDGKLRQSEVEAELRRIRRNMQEYALMMGI